MKTTTKLLGLGLAGAGLLLSACEVPGGGIPPRTIVIPNPGDEPTQFSGFPATFQGTNLVLDDSSEMGTETIFRAYDAFETTVDEPTDLTITCDVYDDSTSVLVESDAGNVVDDFCDQGPWDVTVDGNVYIEVAQQGDPGVYPYSVRADLDDAAES
jgi:hypothetical protein